MTFKASQILDTEDIEAGDMFVLDIAEDHVFDEEPSVNWAEIALVNKVGGYVESLVLTGEYSGTTGTWTGVEKDCLVRRLYSKPADDYWQYAIVGDTFCFTNGHPDTLAQKYTGTGYCTALDEDYATGAKYCIEYANRLCLANLYIDGALRQFTIKTSKEGDPTNWIDSTAVEIDLLDTEDYITGLSKVGPYLVVFKPDSYSLWYRSGESTDPIVRGSWRTGTGCPSPYSIVQYETTVAWLGRNDFYTLNGEVAEPFGEKIRYLFFDLVDETEIKKVWAGVNYLENEIMWVANTIDYGKLAFVWNWRHKEWMIYAFHDDVLCLGRGIV